MFKVVATICSLAAPDHCRDVTVTTSQFSDVTMKSCSIGMVQLSEWMMKEHPNDSFQGWKCVEEDKEKKGI